MIKYSKRRKRGVALKALEQRVKELEQRIDHLESIIQGSEITQQKSYEIRKKPEDTMPKRPTDYTIPAKASKKASSKKFKEAIIGKYFIGALASILVFIAAASFITLVWDSWTPGMKLGALVILSIAITALGFISIRRNKNPITSIILGTGAGLLFISILSANMYFNFIGSTTSIILAGLWSAFFILSYRYTQTYFTSIIAYMGSYIAIALGLSLIVGMADYIVLLLFATGISALMIITSHKWTDYSKQVLSLLLSILSYSTLLLWGLDNEVALGIQIFQSGRLLFTLAFIAIYFLLNYMYRLIDRDKKKSWYLIVSLLTSFLVTVSTRLYTDTALPFLKSPKTVWLFFIAINLAQLIFIELKFKRITKPLTKYYVSVIGIATLALNYEIFNSLIGLVPIVIVLLIIERVMNHNNYSKIIQIGLAVDIALLLINHEVSNSIFILYGLLQICAASYLLYVEYETGKAADLFRLKTIGLFVYMINSVIIPANIAYIFNGERSHLASYIGATLMIILLNAIGFFKEWNSKDFKLFDKNENVLDDKTIFLFYVITTILYIRGIALIGFYSSYRQLVVIAATLAIALIQTISILRHHNNSEWIGFWIGLKYWILTWASLTQVFSLDASSIIISVAGLMIALGSIAVGFFAKTKSLRLYGLAFTILMVLKFIIIDLSQENSVTRIVALLVGGLICFGISILYNKLNNMIEE